MATPGNDWVGLTLSSGRYEVVDRLGEGGMGVVYRAWDRNLETDVVIKVPRRSMLEDARFAGRFTREIRSLVQLSHPHIVKVLDVGEHDGLAFAVMQYLSGGTLRDRCQHDGSTRAVRPNDLARWLEDVADALDYIHAKGYVHRDVKPENVLLDESGNVCLSDFGIAKILAESKTLLTGTGAVVGTPHYMSPEQLQEQPYDGRVDQYALAVMTFELLAGRRPFEGPAAVVIALHMTQQPPVLHELTPGVPPALSRCVARGLAKQPDERYPSCRAFALAVLEALQTPVLQTTPPRASAANPTSAGNPALTKTATAVCPGCGKRLTVRGAPSGRRLRCPHCQEVFQPPRTQVKAAPDATLPPAGDDDLETLGATPAPASSQVETRPPPPKTLVERRSAPDGTGLRAVERRRRSPVLLFVALGGFALATAAALYFSLAHRTPATTQLAEATTPATESSPPLTLPATRPTTIEPTEPLALRLQGVKETLLTAGGVKQVIRYPVERRGVQAGPIELQLVELPQGVQVNQGKPIVLAPQATELVLDWQADAFAPARSPGAVPLTAKLDGEAVPLTPGSLTVAVRQPMLKLEAPTASWTLAAGEGRTFLVQLDRDGFQGPVRLVLKGPPGKLTSPGVELGPGVSAGEVPVTATADAEGELDAVLEAARAANKPEAVVKVKVRVVNAGAALKRGDEQLKQRRYAKAAEEYSAVIQSAPTSLPAHLGRAKAFIALRDYKQAREDCMQALKLDRTDRLPNFLLGQICLAEDSWEKAQEHFLLALDDQKPDAELHVQRGWARYLSGALDRAVEDFRKAVSIDPKHALGHAHLGLALAAQQKYDDALVASTRAVELDARQPQVQRERGEVYRLLAVDPSARPRDLKPGLEAYGKALELDPRDAYSLVGRARLHAWLGAPKKAIDDLLPAIKLNREAVKDAPSARVTQRLNTECADIYFHLGKAQAALGNHDKAISEFDRALETCSRFDDKPLRTQIREERGLSHLQLKQPDKALEDFDDALDLNRNNARAHAFKGYALHLLKRNDQAKTILADAIILSNQQWGWPYLARSLANRAIGLVKEEEADRLKAKQLGCTALFPVR